MLGLSISVIFYKVKRVLDYYL